MTVYIHSTAEVSPKATIGVGTRIWHEAQVREDAKIGEDCIISKGVYVDFDVEIGARCKLQNGVFVYHGATLADGVMLGPGAMLLNDKHPRAITPEGELKTDADWQVRPISIGYGAGIGGGAIILPGVTIGKWAIVGSGAVVTRDVPDYGLVYGNPARLFGFVCSCGDKLALKQKGIDQMLLRCPICDREVEVPTSIYYKIQQVHKL